MPELPFPDLATPAARETKPPPFEQVVGRARRRRRNNVLAVAAGTAAVLALVSTGAIVTLGDKDVAPAPVRPSPIRPTPSGPTTPGATPDQTSGADATEVARDGRLVAYAATGQALMTVWELCGKGADRNLCRYAWQLQGPGGIHRDLLRGSTTGAYAAGEHFVLVTWGGRGIVVDLDGRARALHQVDPGTVTSGDALVRTERSLAVVDPVAAAYWPLPVSDGVEGWIEGAITRDGTVWATSSAPDPAIDARVSWLEPHATPTSWQHHTISTTFADGPVTGPLAVAGDHVAVPSLHDGVDVATYGVFAVTTDDGASWSDLRPSDLPFDNVDAMAATAGGTLYVASMDDHGEDRVFRSTDATWRRFVEIPGAAGAYNLVTAGDRVVARRGSRTRSELLRLDDAGHVSRWAVFTG